MDIWVWLEWKPDCVQPEWKSEWAWQEWKSNCCWNGHLCLAGMEISGVWLDLKCGFHWNWNLCGFGWIWNVGLAGIEGGERESFSVSPQHTLTYREVRHFAFTLITLCRETLTPLPLYVWLQLGENVQMIFELDWNLDRNEVAGSVLVELWGTSFCRPLIGRGLEKVACDWLKPDTNIPTSQTQQWWHSPGRPWKVQTSWAVRYFYPLLQRTSR